jgi:hypothetical protein
MTAYLRGDNPSFEELPRDAVGIFLRRCQKTTSENAPGITQKIQRRAKHEVKHNLRKGGTHGYDKKHDFRCQDR